MNKRFKYLLIISVLLVLFLENNYSQNKKDNFIVVLDAGHGGKDSGNRGNGHYEKKIALKIALGIGSILEKVDDIRVIYTRKKDVFVSLIKRAKIANDANADLFVSIHCDAHSSNAYGAGTFVLGLHANQRNFEIAKKENSVIFYEENFEENYDGFDPNSPESVISLTLMQEAYLDQSISAASEIQKSFVKNLNRKDRTVKQAGFIVLKYTYMPSVLVEAGFLTNKREGNYLNSRKGQNDMAKAISKAIINYKNQIQLKVNSNEIFNDKNPGENVKLIYKIQIAASKNNLPLKKYNFKGLNNLSKVKENGLFKYFYGSTSDIKEAEKLMKIAKRKGYKSAFIVSFKNGLKVK